jgi:hypothetical protein
MSLENRSGYWLAWMSSFVVDGATGAGYKKEKEKRKGKGKK